MSGKEPSENDNAPSQRSSPPDQGICEENRQERQNRSPNVPGGKCPAGGSKTYAQPRCQQCGYDEAAAIESYDAVPAFVPWAKLFRRPIPPACRADIPWRNPLLAACLGAVVIGAGHLYVGKRLEGVGYLATAILLTWAFFAVFIFALFFLAVIWEMQPTEAYDRAVEFDWASIIQAEMGGPRGQQSSDQGRDCDPPVR